MTDNDNLFDNIQRLFTDIPNNFNILEYQVDINVQIEYFEYSKKHKGKVDKQKLFDNKNILFDKTVPIEEKKKMLVQLSSIEDVEIFRTIEKYLKNPDKELENWAILALQESRILLESSLLDENKVFISTGLGGKGTKLRYFLVLTTKNEETLNKFQKEQVVKELNFILKNNNVDIENLSFTDYNYFTITCLVQISDSLQKIFRLAIEEINQFGDFLSPNFLVTNIKILSNDEILDYLK